jgi:hypothetical protein
MPLSELKHLEQYIRDHEPTLNHNADLLRIYEGELLPFIVKDLRHQLSGESFEVARNRIAPINMAIKVIDKLSQIYANPPKRSIVDGTGKDTDVELLQFYESEMQINAQMDIANELFNLHKNTSIEPFVEKGMPRLRSVPSDRSLWYSNDTINPMSPTHWVKCMGERYIEGHKQDVYYIYTDEEFYIVDLLMYMPGIWPTGLIPSRLSCSAIRGLMTFIPLSTI